MITHISIILFFQYFSLASIISHSSHLITFTLQESQDLQTSKRQKIEVIEKETILPTIDRSTEVEDILSGKVLDTDIPGLEELMSTESK